MLKNQVDTAMSFLPPPIYCQAKVQVQSLKSKSKVKSKVLSQKDLDFAYSIIIQPTTITHH